MKKPIYKRIWFWILIVIVVFAVIGMAGGSDDDSSADDATVATSSNDATETDTSDDASDSDASEGEEEEDSEEYTIENVSIDGDSYSVTISGTFTNQTGKDLSYVSVSYNLYDSDGAQIDTALANTTNLAAGNSWKFEALGLESIDDVADYELVEVTYY